MTKKKIRPSDISPFANAFSGAVGGAVANFAVYPLSVVVTKLQIQNKKSENENDKKYDGMLDCLLKIYNENGLKGLLSGAGEDTVAVMTAAFFYFYAYDAIRSSRLSYLKRKIGKAPSTLGVAEELSIGTVAGMFCKFITAPLNNVVTRKQATKSSTSTKQVAIDIYNEKGVTGFWTGYKNSIILSINPSLTYYFFQYLKAILIPRRRRANPSSMENFFLSALAKTIATLLTYPWMLSKTRLQASTGKQNSDEKNQKRRFKVVTDVTDKLQHEGLGSVYQGCKSQVVRSFFSQGITMMTKDEISRTIIYIYFVFTRRVL